MGCVGLVVSGVMFVVRVVELWLGCEFECRMFVFSFLVMGMCCGVVGVRRMKRWNGIVLRGYVWLLVLMRVFMVWYFGY